MSAWAASRAARGLSRVLSGTGREHLHGADADGELRRDLLGAPVVDLARKQRGALADGQVGEIVDEPVAISPWNNWLVRLCTDHGSTARC
jgi:hypothetical protein